MSIVGIQGWDPSNTTTFYTNIGWSFGTDQISLSFPAGRFGGQCLRASETGAGGNGAFVTYTLSSSSSIGGVTMAYRPSRADTNYFGTLYGLIRALEGGTLHTDIYPASSGAGYVLVARRNGTTLATGTTVLPLSNWTAIEFYTEIHDTTGRVVVYVNGNSTPEIDFTGDTRNGGTGVISSWSFVPAAHTNNGGNLPYDMDDIVIYNDAGSVNNTHPIGDLKVENIVPTGAGNSTQFTPSAGSNWQNVDEKPPDSDTTYNQSPTTGHKDTYVMADLAGTGGILAVQPVLFTKKTDAGTRQIASVTRLSATEVDGSTKNLTTGYLATNDIHETKPGGGSWTVTDVNNAEIGIKVVT